MLFIKANKKLHAWFIALVRMFFELEDVVYFNTYANIRVIELVKLEFAML